MFRRAALNSAVLRTSAQSRASSAHPNFGVWNPMGPVIFGGAVIGACWMVFSPTTQTAKGDGLLARSGLGFASRTFVQLWM